VAAGGGRLPILARQSIRRARSAGGDNLAAAWPVLSCYPPVIGSTIEGYEGRITVWDGAVSVMRRSGEIAGRGERAWAAGAMPVIAESGHHIALVSRPR
jgi:hypothetical protein